MKTSKKSASGRRHAAEIYARLSRRYPNAHCALDFSSPFQLLVATILSAQCTDKRVNLVTPTLFARYTTPEALSEGNPDEVEGLIRSTGFFRSKTKSLIGMATAIVKRHEGRVPEAMSDLVELPGVGRKTANVVLGNAFGANVGVVVDTHVGRVSRRLGMTREEDPVKVEQDLMALFSREQWTMLAHLFIEHGRGTCVARKPRCSDCVLNDLCPSSTV